MLHDLLVMWFGWVKDWGYPGVVVLMAMESSIFPVPSEVVVPPAAYLATLPGARMSVPGVIIAGTLGSYLGAAITYWVTWLVGRPLVARWGRLVLISPEKLARAERWIHRYEAGGIFFARLLPVVRHLISIPAGLVRMDFRVFSLMTLVGSAIWCAILAWFGAKVGKAHPDAIDDPEKFVLAVKAEALWIVLAIAVLCALYFLVMRLTRPKEPVHQP